jgi:hypothetical protein
MTQKHCAKCNEAINFANESDNLGIGKISPKDWWGRTIRAYGCDTCFDYWCEDWMNPHDWCYIYEGEKN